MFVSKSSFLKCRSRPLAERLRARPPKRPGGYQSLIWHVAAKKATKTNRSAAPPRQFPGQMPQPRIHPRPRLPRSLKYPYPRPNLVDIPQRQLPVEPARPRHVLTPAPSPRSAPRAPLQSWSPAPQAVACPPETEWSPSTFCTFSDPPQIPPPGRDPWGKSCNGS